MWQQGHRHNDKHDEYTDIDLFANCPLNTTKSYELGLYTSTSARQKLCLRLWGLQSYYFSRHDPTQTLASVECLLFNDGDGRATAGRLQSPSWRFLADTRTQTQITPDTSDGCCSPVCVANFSFLLSSRLSSAVSLTLHLRLAFIFGAHTGSRKESHAVYLRHSQKGPSGML